jgi:hypothetical protein
MTQMNLHKTSRQPTGCVLLMVTEPAWAILRVWRRTAVTSPWSPVPKASSLLRSGPTIRGDRSGLTIRCRIRLQPSKLPRPPRARKTPQQKLQDLRSLFDRD